MAPNASSVVEKVGDFDLICTLKSNDLFPVHKYRSSVTGLTVVIAEVEGPVVNGYFCLATEAHDDDGLPHTLEHLIFLGSKQYPYKGVLDLLANRCLASGTNAWTDTDHTCYTMTTAGIEGFLSLLPIYLDHILYPTLTDSGFATEVHHVTGSGEDGGVVYCEMQGRETTAESLAHRALAQALYPGDCGYSAETGGVLSNLRESTDNIKVRAYHRDFYRPENLTLVVAGATPPEAILAALSGRRDNAVERPAFQRPWQDPVPPLGQSVDSEVLFPCDDEDSGLVRLGWRGPSAVTELTELAACAVLLKYLTDTSVAPLAAAFVETQDPLASSVSFSLIENRESALVIGLDGVPSSKLSSAPGAVSALLARTDSLDMGRLRSVLRRHALETLSFLEAQPHAALAFALIGDMLHGESDADLDRRMNAVSELRALADRDESFWLALLRRYLVEAPTVAVSARPSRAEQRRLETEEKERVALRVAEWGDEGLAKRGEELDKAMKDNEVPPPSAMLTSVPVPSVDGIRFIPVTGFEADAASQHPKLDLRKAPVHATLDHLAANFIYLTALLDTSGLTAGQRELLPLLLELLTESPVRRDGELVPHATVVAELEAETVHAGAGLGVGGGARFTCGPFSATATLALQLEPGKLGKGLRWLRELLYATELTTERVRVVAAKMVNDVARAKRKGNKVAQDLLRSLCFAPESNHVHGGALRQHRALTALLSRLDGTDGAAALAELEATRQAIVAPRRVALHVAADADRLDASEGDVWAELLPEGVAPEQAKLNVVPDWSQLSPSLKTRGGDGSDGCVVGLGCVESCFVSHAVPSITDPEDPDLAPLLVFLQYLTQLEGPMWRRVRGAGLAYGYSVVPRPHEGLLHLSLYRATNGAAAFREMRDICLAQLGADAVWEPALLAAARSSLVFEVVDRERSVGEVVSQAMLARFRGVGQQYNRELVLKVAAVTEADLARVGPLHVAPLFEAGRSRTAIVCPPARTAELTAAFQEMGCNLTVSTLEDCFLARC